MATGHWLKPLFLILLVGALYGWFLENPIVFDDLYFFILDEGGRSVVFDWYDWRPWLLRSLPYASLAWTAEIFGFGLIPFRIGNLILHIAVTLSLFYFLCALLRSVLPEERRDTYHRPVFFAALLFGLHPVAVYAAGYLVQRTTLMATLFAVLSMAAYLRGTVSGGRRWAWASVGLYYLAVFSKEHALMLPAAFVLLEGLLHPDWRQRVRANWRLFAVCAAIAFIVVLERKGLIGSAYELEASSMLQDLGVEYPYPMSVLTQCWLFFKYGALWLLPNPDWMSVDMREPFAKSFASVYLVAPVLFLAYGAVAARLLLRRGKAGLVGFALLFPWVMFLTELATVRIQEPFVLYRSYLWAIGGMVVLPVIAGAVRRRVAYSVVAALTIAYIPISVERLETFSHPYLLWDDAEKLVRGRNDAIGAYRIYYNRGTECMKFLNFSCAISDLKHSIALYPGFPEAYGNLGSAYLQTGQWQAAVDNLSQAIQIDNEKQKPNWRHYWWRAQAYQGMGLQKESVTDYAVTCLLNRKGCDKAGMPEPPVFR